MSNPFWDDAIAVLTTAANKAAAEEKRLLTSAFEIAIKYLSENKPSQGAIPNQEAWNYMGVSQLATIEPLDREVSEKLLYKKHLLHTSMSPATPDALLERAAMLRSVNQSNIRVDTASLAAHIKLAADTISELRKHLSLRPDESPLLLRQALRATTLSLQQVAEQANRALKYAEARLDKCGCGEF